MTMNKREATKNELDAFREWNLSHGNQEGYRAKKLEIVDGPLYCTQQEVAVGCYVIDERQLERVMRP